MSLTEVNTGLKFSWIHVQKSNYKTGTFTVDFKQLLSEVLGGRKMIENLRKYEGKNIILTDTDGKQYVGYVSGYIFADNNESKGLDAIIIDCSESESPIQFNNDEISSIKCIMDSRRVELSVHTGMSENDGINTAGDYINEALRDFMPAIAITDHDSVQAFPEVYKVLVNTRALENDGIKLIYGTEIHYKRENKKYNVSILAKNQQGLKKLYKILSEVSSSEEGTIVTIESISSVLTAREHLVFGINLMNELLDLIIDGKSDSELENFISDFDYVMLNPLGHYRYYIEDSKIKNEDQLKEIYKRVIDICDKTGVRAVASDDAHYIFEDDGEARKILLYNKGFERYENQPKLHFRNTDEMLAEFDFLPGKTAQKIVIENTRAIADLVEGNFPPFSQDKILPKIENAESDLKELSYMNAKRIYGDNLPEEVVSRLEWELGAIIGSGYASIFIAAMKIAEKFMQKGYLVGNRGLISSSLVAYLLKITEINPLAPHYICSKCHFTEFNNKCSCGIDMPDKPCPKCGKNMKKDGFNIPVEFFLGFYGDKEPDIDLNLPIETDRVSMLEELFGEGKVLRAGTVWKISPKLAFGYIEAYCKHNRIKFSDIRENEIAEALYHVKRTSSGIHPGGYLILPKSAEIYDYTPFGADSLGKVTHFDYRSLSNLYKFDLLEHDDPAILKKLQDLTDVNPKEIPFGDEKTMKLFEIGHTQGIYDFSNKFVRTAAIPTVKPKTFDELIRISGLSHGTGTWIDNADDLIYDGKKITEVISCREDIYLYLIKNGLERKTVYKIAESVRKGRELTEEQEEQMLRIGVPEWYIESCNSVSYLFPRSHAATYTLFAYRIAYFKAHYPKEFYSTLFELNQDYYSIEDLIKMQDSIKDVLENEDVEHYKIAILELFNDMIDSGYVFDMEKVNSQDFSEVFVKEASK